jgi:hypothetical protein
MSFSAETFGCIEGVRYAFSPTAADTFLVLDVQNVKSHAITLIQAIDG